MIHLHLIELFRYTRPFHLGNREGFLLKLTALSGQISWGEIAPLPGFSQESLYETEQELYDILPRLRAKTPFLCSSPSVQFGIESALADLLSPIHLPPIPVNALIRAEELSNWDQRGYEVVKIKVGHLRVEEGVKAVQSARSKLKNIQVRIDANRAWSLEEGLFFARQTAIPHLDYFEEPLRCFEELFAFPYPLALDESFREGWLKKGNVPPHLKAIVLKPTLQWEIPKLEEKEVDFILSSSYESEVGLAQIAKRALREKLPLRPMGLDTHRLFKDALFEEALKVKEGKLYFPREWTLKKEGANGCFRMSF